MSGTVVTTPLAGPMNQPPVIEPFPGWGQSLYTGAAGIALAHIHAARTGTGDWATAHRWVTAMTRQPISANPDTCGLHYGAPAVAFVLHTATQPDYQPVLERLDSHVATIIRHRLARAHARIDAGRRPVLAEYDLIRGLTGLGAYLLHRRTNDNLLHDVLRYLVRLTHPLTADGVTLPGWWTDHGPHDQPSVRWPGGHANLGIAHGITGPLALLATTARHGITVDGQTDAIGYLCDWLDGWRGGSSTRAWWPGMISLAEYQTGVLTQSGPQRPSWCYGTPGLARAQQLAGLALNNPTRQQIAEHALAGCIADPTQLARLGDTSLCHGWAGVLQTAWRMADDSQAGEAFAVPLLARRLTTHLNPGNPAGTPNTDPHLLAGNAGTQLIYNLVHDTSTSGRPPDSGWDTCLLLAG